MRPCRNSSWERFFLVFCVFFLLTYKICGLFPGRIYGFIDSKIKLRGFQGFLRILVSKPARIFLSRRFPKMCFHNYWVSGSFGVLNFATTCLWNISVSTACITVVAVPRNTVSTRFIFKSCWELPVTPHPGLSICLEGPSPRKALGLNSFSSSSEKQPEGHHRPREPSPGWLQFNMPLPS